MELFYTYFQYFNSLLHIPYYISGVKKWCHFDNVIAYLPESCAVSLLFVFITTLYSPQTCTLLPTLLIKVTLCVPLCIFI